MGVAYVLAAARRSPRGRRSPISRTIWFTAARGLVGVIYGSGLQVYEDHPSVHAVQHMLVMMALPALLVFAAPVALLLWTLHPARAVRQAFVACGLFFWFPVAGLDPVRLRLRERAKQQSIAIGLPALGLLGAIELARGDSATGWSCVASGAALTIAGSLLASLQGRRRAAPAMVPGAGFTPVRPESAAVTGAVGPLGERSLSGSA